ncbi:MAG: GlsB/YeaQ/YmgE family stress response membrane protein [Ktedonobacterales bacterium]
MVIASFTVTFSDLALQILAGAIAAAIIGRVQRGGGFGIIGDLLFGVIGAIGANFVVSTFSLFNVAHYGLPAELVIAVIGAILLVVIVHLFTGRRSAGAGA